MKDIEISRDKKNPTWAWVWNKKDQSDIRKTIILDIFEPVPERINTGICLAVHLNDIKNYIEGKSYCLSYWDNYEIIKEPTYRPIKTIEDYIEATKDRNDLRVIAKDETFFLNLGIGQIDKETKKIFFRGYDGEYIFENCVWLDDRSLVGVKCL